MCLLCILCWHLITSSLFCGSLFSNHEMAYQDDLDKFLTNKATALRSGLSVVLFFYLGKHAGPGKARPRLRSRWASMKSLHCVERRMSLLLWLHHRTKDFLSGQIINSSIRLIISLHKHALVKLQAEVFHLERLGIHHLPKTVVNVCVQRVVV